MIKNFVQYLHDNELYIELHKSEDIKMSEIVEYEDFEKVCKTMPKSVIKDFFEYEYVNAVEYNRYYSLSDILDELCYKVDSCDLFDTETFEDAQDEEIADKLEKCINEYLVWALKQKIKVSWPAN